MGDTAGIVAQMCMPCIGICEKATTGAGNGVEAMHIGGEKSAYGEHAQASVVLAANAQARVHLCRVIIMHHHRVGAKGAINESSAAEPASSPASRSEGRRKAYMAPLRYRRKALAWPARLARHDGLLACFDTPYRVYCSSPYPACGRKAATNTAWPLGTCAQKRRKKLNAQQRSGIVCT